MVRRILRFIPTRVPQFVEEASPFRSSSLRHENTHHDSTRVGAVIAVMKDADAPVGVQGADEGHQGTRAFRKLEAVEQFLAVDRWGLTC